MKRIIAWILCAVLLLSSSSMQTFAQELGDSGVNEYVESVADVSGEDYSLTDISGGDEALDEEVLSETDIEEDLIGEDISEEDYDALPHTINNTGLNLETMETCENKEEGWSWNAETATLILENFTMKWDAETTTLRWGIICPDYTTIICKGNNVIDWRGSGSEYRPIITDYNLSLVVLGSLKLYGDGEDVCYASVFRLSGDVTKGTVDNAYIYGASVDNYYEVDIEASASPSLYFTDEPARYLYKTTMGKALSAFKASAHVAGGTGEEAIKYSWYASESKYDKLDSSTLVGEGTSFKPDVSKAGGMYYQCVASYEKDGVIYKAYSRVKTVVVGYKGVNPVTDCMNFKSMEDGAKGPGWSWNGKTNTLTLNNFAGIGDGFTPFWLYFYELEDDVNIVLAQGSSNIVEGIYVRSCSNLKISGTGKMEAKYISSLGYNAHVTICGGASVTMKGDFNQNTGSLTLNKGKLYCVGEILAGDITLKSSSELSAGRKVQAGNNMTIGSGCKVSVIRPDSYWYHPVFVSNKLEVSGELIIGGVYDSEAVCFQSSGPEDNIDNHLNLKGTAICEPEDVEWINEDGAIYSKRSGHFVIMPTGYSLKSLSKVTIAEDAAGRKLKVSSISPADATVDYFWEVSETPSFLECKKVGNNEAYWDIMNAYEGEYVRLKVQGYGEYKGTVISNIYGPVKPLSADILDIIINGESLNKKLKFDSSETTAYPNCDIYDEKVWIEIVTADPGAEVLIENITETSEGVVWASDAVKSIEGKEGSLSLAYIKGSVMGNDVTITVTAGDGEEKKYNLYGIYSNWGISHFSIYNNYNSQCANIEISWTEDGENKTVSPMGEPPEIAPNTCVTVTAQSKYKGWHVSDVSCGKYEFFDVSVADGIWKGSCVTDYSGGNFYISVDEFICEAPKLKAELVREELDYMTPVTFIRLTGDMTLPALADDDGYYFTGGDGKLVAALFDEWGNYVDIYNRSDVYDEDHGVEVITTGEAGTARVIAWDGCENTWSDLDTTRTYYLKLWYNVGRYFYETDGYCDVQTIEIKPKNSDINLESNRIAIECPSTEKASVKEVGFSCESLENVRTSVRGDTDHINVTLNEDKLIVKVLPGAECGTSYICLKNGIEKILTVDVIEAAAEVKGYLTVKTGTLNLYSSPEIRLPINITGDASAIETAEFMNAATGDKYAIKASGDRELTIYPRDIIDGDFDWAAKLKSLSGKFTSDIRVELKSGKSIALSGYSFTVKADTPKVTVGKAALNSYYENDSTELKISVKGENITRVTPDNGKAGLKTAAVPAWLELSEEGTISLKSNELTGNKASGNIYLKVWLEGKAYPVQTKIQVSVSYKAPSFKLSAQTITYPSDSTIGNGNAKLFIIPGKGYSLEDLNIADVKVADLKYLAGLSDKDKKTYEASRYYTIRNFDSETGEIELKSTLDRVIPGKAMLVFILGGNPDRTLTLPVTIKAVEASKITVKPDKSSITLNRVWGTAEYKEEKNITMVTSAMGIFDEYIPNEVEVKIVDSKKNDYTEFFNVEPASGERLQYNISLKQDLPNGTYTATFNYENVKDKPKVKIVVNKKAPTLKLSKTKASFDIYDAWDKDRGYSNKPVIVEFTTSDKDKVWELPFTPSLTAVVKDSAGPVADVIMCNPYADNENQTIGEELYLSSEAAAGDYTVTFTLTMPNGDSVKANVKVTVTAKLPQVKLSKSVVTLNKDLNKLGTDVAYIERTYPEGYYYEADLPYEETNKQRHEMITYEVYDHKGNPVEEPVIGVFDNFTYINPYLLDKATPGETYTVKYTERVQRISSDGTKFGVINYSFKVKVAAQKKGITPITQSTSVKGSIDLPQMDNSVEVITKYSGWNGVVGFGNGEVPSVSWKVTAKDGKKAYTGPLYEGKDAVDGDVTLWFKEPYSYYSGNIEPGVLHIEADATNYFKFMDPSLKYTITVTTTFPGYNTDGTDLVISKSQALKFTSGKVNISVKPSSVILSKYDRYDSEVVSLSLAGDGMHLVKTVKIKGSSQYDCTLLNEYAYGDIPVAIGWKGDTVSSKPKAETLTLEIYLEGNDAKWKKPNATVKIKVTPK